MRKLPYSIGIIALIRELWYTVCQMRDEPAAAPYLQTFIDLHQEAKTVLLPAELGIYETIDDGQAKVDKADAGLDIYAGRVWREVEAVAELKTKKKLKTNLFKGLPLSRFRRPVLGGQLLTQSGWGAALQGSNIPSLVALAPAAGPLVKAGQDASKARTDAQQANRQFRDLGQRKQFIDRVNGARLLADGALSKAPLEDPSLPSDYAERFWLGEPAQDEEETIDDVKADITDLKSKLEVRTATLAKMEADAAAAAKIEEDRQAKLKSIDDLHAQRAEIDAKIAALQAEIEE